ncbi:rod shape-determining protein [Shewanella mangrovisoli]|uniref:rod shape-determining protein n=1 Tax=Shewanella mangrovisoli TaxID=2864211 RepID=UPI001C655496|nr:rod shape-determining protein [Shewanella mangrovisoli]QYK10861.1 rod shape-determining protein [Shewanella mangrovisoli]
MNVFTWLKGLVSKDVLIELTEAKITIKSFGDKTCIEYEPVLALVDEPTQTRIKAIGREAMGLQGEGVRLVNPFSHPRMFVASFELAEKLLQYGISQLHTSGFRATPRVIVHQLEKTEGGLTDIEDRVLRELAMGAGAREVVIYLGPRLNTDLDTFDEIKRRVETQRAYKKLI